MIARATALAWACALAVACAVVLSYGRRAAAQPLAPCGNPNDFVPDDEALQTCLDRGGRIELEAGYPGYIVNGYHGDAKRGLQLTQSGTVLTTKTNATTATILAGRDLYDGILQTPPGIDVNGFVIDGIDFNGLGDTMIGGEPYRRHRNECGSRTAGNLALRGRAFVFRNNTVENAMCGTGLGLYGNFDVRYNYIVLNGRDQPLKAGDTPWSDGISVLYCDAGYIGSNVFADNTDIDLVVGGGHDCIVESNTITHLRRFGVAGMNIGNFDGPGAGDHTGSQYRLNTIDSFVPNKLGMGLIVGSHPWDMSRWVYAGRITGNTVYGANINMVVDGVYGGEVSGNTTHDPSQTGDNACGHVGRDYTIYPPHVINTAVQGGWVELRYDRDWCGSRNAAGTLASQHTAGTRSVVPGAVWLRPGS
jgi:hypothetical protein